MDEERVIRLTKQSDKVFGPGVNELVTVEELNELSQALVRFILGKSSIQRVVEELADVKIMLTWLESRVNRKKLNKHINQKLDKLEEKIMEAKK